MTVCKKAWSLGFSAPGAGIFPESPPPVWIWGQGTPAAISPFTDATKSALYSQVDSADDDPHLWMKVDSSNSISDWVNIGDVGVTLVKSELFDISATDFERVIFHAVTQCEILEIGILYNEATAASGLEGGDLTVGTTSGGAEICAAYTYTASQGSGTYIALDIVSGALAAGTSVFASHDIASGAAGTYFILAKIRVEA